MVLLYNLHPENISAQQLIQYRISKKVIEGIADIINNKPTIGFSDPPSIIHTKLDMNIPINTPRVLVYHSYKSFGLNRDSYTI